jgi:hypothetical protein
MKMTERKLRVAREKAEQAFTESTRREAAFIEERNRIRSANDEKTARLRALRLAKEAVDKEAAAGLAASPCNE